MSETINRGLCAECGESTRHKDGCRAWEVQLTSLAKEYVAASDPSTAPVPAPTKATTPPSEEVWRWRFAGCREIRRLLDRAESAAADALLYPARGIASADDNERLDKSFRHLYQLAMGEVARLGGDEVCLDALAMLLPLEFGQRQSGCLDCGVTHLPHGSGCAWLGLMQRAGLR
jgi:hypothetical protein